MRRRIRSSAASVALLCVGVAIVAAGLATAHLSMVTAGVVLIVLGWLAATTAAARSSR